MHLRAVIYLRGLDPRAHQRCQLHCEQRGYRVVGVVVDQDGARWPEVLDAAFRGQYEVAVMASLDDLPPDRVPRMEVARPAWHPLRQLERRPRPA